MCRAACKFSFLLLTLFASLRFVAAQQVIVKPYIQPGDNSALGESDSRVLSWITEGEESPFTVEYGADENYGQKAAIVPTPLPLNGKKYVIYRALLSGLPFDSKVSYKVTHGDTLVRKSVFETRSKVNPSISFVLVGDLAKKKAERSTQIAYQISKKAPQMGLIVGDIVYEQGLFSEYLDHYAPVYINEDEASPEKGTSVLAQSTFYFAIGNHDIKGMDLSKTPDGLAAFYMWQSPLNGPTNLPFIASPRGSPEQVSAFKDAAGKAFPALFNYSFDNGPAHFLVLDANAYVNVANKEWTSWIENDLKNSNARWKFVCFHQPGFQSSKTHYEEQRMRVFSPLFERCGVDAVLCGHVHNYQRSKPLSFVPAVDVQKVATALASSKMKEIDGKFTIDNEFNGVDKTNPKGIIYLVSGSGGAEPYDVDFTNNPEKWVHPSKNWAPFTEKFIADRSSFSYVTVDHNTFDFQQIDQNGNVIDSFKMTKP